MEKIEIQMDDNYEIHVGVKADIGSFLDEADPGKGAVVVIGCDCSDVITDVEKMITLRDALTTLIEEKKSVNQG